MDWLTGEADKELPSLFDQQVFNLSSGTVYFPIRHHSPACSFHLLKVMKQYKPDIVLIEGPASGTPLIPVLADEATETPVSLYCTYEDEQGGRSACYYPLLSYSPEYVAMKEAAHLGIPAAFIDLDYSHESRTKAEKQETSIQDETLLASSDFINRLCRKMNCRSFDELWEKLFEIEGQAATTEAFVRNVFTYCALSRMCYSEEQLRASGDMAREKYMRECIKQAVSKHKHVLVITGGFHTYGLLEAAQAYSPAREEQQKEQQGKKGGAIQQQLYPMVYTFEEADRLNGYASGMPYVNYYELIWNKLLQHKTEPYNQTALALLSELMRKLRKGQEEVSTSDAIEAYSMFQGLAVLRGKREGGVYELLDAALSSFVKGERTLATDKPLEELRLLLTGDKIGIVAPNPFTVPIVEDFKNRCSASGLQIKTTGKHKKVLDLYAKAEHRLLSQLLQCASFLVPDFAIRESGPDWVAYRHMNLVRETWVYAYSSRIEARLIENSLYGGTLKEAAARKIGERIQELPDHHSGEIANALLQALLMGLQDTARRLYEQVQAALRKDGNFLSLCQTLTVLNRLRQHGRLLGLAADEQLPLLVAEAYNNAVDKLLGLAAIHSDEHPAIIQGLKLLAMLAESSESHFQNDTFRGHLSELLSDPKLSPQLEGVAMAILAGLGDRTREEMVERARSYVRGTPEQAKQTAKYLQGMFEIARDAFLYDDLLLGELNYLIEELPPDDFIAMVPELRLAFTYFTPMETSLIAERVAKRHQAEPEELERPPIDEQTLIQAKALDEAIRKEFAAWKLI
ncbi:DUF5682 family protein [Paenibacillus sp. Leaf72]|uniref:DUF5682 family protein n=1 Tax=Paenibacillus sp. Leaf72 TaxID=1736234 RepID=UPI0006FEEC81|nr:DUF5682 family protein [Paenibacillus sp. Leaf72]KQO18166.1 hypothetical protein ASF12_05880 [Paenibacillus sp. Leaf72]